MGIETALIGSAIIGGISANSASNRAKQAAEESQDLNRQGLALQERQQMLNEQRYMDSQLEYEKWSNIYGPLQEDLGTYYRNLSGADLSNSEVTRIQQASQRAKDKISRSMAQSGRANSGLESYLLAQTDYNAELEKAQSRSTAEERAIAAKSNFLAIGLNQANNIKNQQSTIVNQTQAAINNQQTALTNMGQQTIAAANQQNSIWSDYGQQLQGLVGYGYGTGEFNTAGTASVSDFSSIIGAF